MDGSEVLSTFSERSADYGDLAEFALLAAAVAFIVFMQVLFAYAEGRSRKRLEEIDEAISAPRTLPPGA